MEENEEEEENAAAAALSRTSTLAPGGGGESKRRAPPAHRTIRRGGARCRLTESVADIEHRAVQFTIGAGLDLDLTPQRFRR
jgi:hypothetical protein